MSENDVNDLKKFVSPDGKYMAVFKTRDCRDDMEKLNELAEPFLEKEGFFDPELHLTKEENEAIDTSNVIVAILEKKGKSWDKVGVVKFRDGEVSGPHFDEEYWPEYCPQITAVGKNFVIAKNYDVEGKVYHYGFFRDEKDEWNEASLGNPHISKHVIAYETGQIYYMNAKTGKFENTGYARRFLGSHLDLRGLDTDGFTIDVLGERKESDPYSNANFLKHVYVKRQADGSYKEDFVSNDFIIKCKFADNAYFTVPNIRTQEDASLYIDNRKVDDGIQFILDNAYIKNSSEVVNITKENKTKIIGVLNGEYFDHVENIVLSKDERMNYINVVDKHKCLEIASTTDDVSVFNGDDGVTYLDFYDGETCEHKASYDVRDFESISAIGYDKEDQYGAKYAREIQNVFRKGNAGR